MWAVLEAAQSSREPSGRGSPGRPRWALPPAASLLLLSSVLWLAVLPARAGAETHPAHYLVFEIDASGAIQPLFHRLVGLSARPRSMSEAALVAAVARARPDQTSMLLRLHNAAGQVTFREPVRVPQLVRGEFAGEAQLTGGWKIEPYRFAQTRRAFVARVPADAGGQLVIEGPTTAIFDLDELSRLADTLPLSRARALQQRAVPAPPPASPENRVDLLIMGDGYQAGEMADFVSDALNLESNFFAVTPYSVYKNYVNVSSLFTASQESGADHPPYDASCTGDDRSCCADMAMLSDPLVNTYVDTAFNARFCAFNIHRLALVDNGLVLAAAAVPDWDHILVLLNDTTYGGAGGLLAVTSTHALAVDIARHEYGHSFTDLADEYDTPNPGFPACSDVNVATPACSVNVTDQTTRALIKWESWILGGTPVPTPETPINSAVVGLFEGGRYLATGMYRPRDSECLMHFLGKDFGEICSQAYVLKLYEGGWGVPISGIDPIEPGTESPAPGVIEIGANSSITLSVELLEPVGGPPLDVIWLVDGAPVPGATSSSFEFSPPGSGSYLVEIRVEDVTAFVHPELVGTSLESSRQWTVGVASIPTLDRPALLLLALALSLTAATVLRRRSATAAAPW